MGITETPVIFPGGGFFIGDTEIQIEWTAENSNIFYTIDGTIPTQSDELFNSFIVQGTTTARFRAFKEVGCDASTCVGGRTTSVKTKANRANESSFK